MGIVRSGRNVTTAVYIIYLPKTNKSSFKFNEMLDFRLKYQSYNFTARCLKHELEVGMRYYLHLHFERTSVIKIM